MDRSISRISPNRPNTTAGRARNLEGKMQSNFETRRHIDVSFDSPDDSYYLMQDLKPSLLPRPIRNRPITAPKPNIEFQL